jgi:hypothetical protein
MYDVDKIKSENSLLHIAELAGAQFTKHGPEWRSACPIHGGDNKSGFAVFDNESRWACFTNDCGTGDVIEFVQKWRNLDFTGACEWLGGQHETDPVKNEEIKRQRIEERNKRLEAEEERKTDLLKEIAETKNWVKYSTILDDNPKYQAIWESQGIPPSWQSYWQLGYCKSFRAVSDGNLFESPSLTIPIFQNSEIRNIRHRLLKPMNPKDKYRPERTGLGALPFYCDADKMYNFDRILYVEGEKKAMVTYLTLDSIKWQVIGIPGKNQWKKELDKLDGQKVFILLDPDALDQAREFAKVTNGYYIKLPLKIDDAINAGLLDKNGIRTLMKGAKREL